MEKKRVLITGASRGIGRAAAVRFASAGYELFLVARHSREKLTTLTDELRARYGTSCLSFVGDVGDAEFARKVCESVGDIDLLINNAGISKLGLLTELSEEEWDEVIGTNLTGVFHFCKYAVPSMVRRQSGRIVNVSSVWGNAGASCEVAYSASKGGVDAFTKALAKELAPSNIQVNAVAFGCIDTEMNASFSTEERQALMEEIPSGRFATPEEAAEFLFTVAHAPSYLTGQILKFDGGWIS